MASAVMPTLVPTTIVPEVLTESNYEYWSTCMESYLKAYDLWEVCTMEHREVLRGSQVCNQDQGWNKRNAMAIHAIQISCSREMLSRIRGKKIATEAWDHLKRLADPTLDLGVVLSAPDRASFVDADRDSFTEYGRLRKALKDGDWAKIEDFLDSNPDAMRTEIDKGGRTMLHCAASAEHVWVMQKLVDQIEPRLVDLEIKDWRGFTPLALTAAQGRTAIAKVLITKHPGLAKISDWRGILPVVHACKRGEGEMTRLLYSETTERELDIDMEMGAINGATLLSNCIACGFLDIASDLIQMCPRFAVTLDMDGLTPFYVLGQRPALFESGCHLRFWQRWIYSCIPVRVEDHGRTVKVYIMDVTKQPQSYGNRGITTVLRRLILLLISYLLKLPGIKNLCAQKLMHTQAINLLPFICYALHFICYRGAVSHQAVVQALKQGNVDFVIQMMKQISELEEYSDINGRNIFSLAIVYRQEKIFNLLHFLPDKEKLTYGTDDSGNNMLHLAAMLAPQDQLAGISGPALQMQRELQWFKEVESIVPPTCKDRLNSDRKTPSEVFSQEHANLVKEGEKWMKEIATSSSFVAALIVTMMFAAAFTIPGGSNDKGAPIFVDDKLFMVFIISDSISLFSATTSVLMFLGILTSEYAEDKFLTRLPTKLIIGLSTLFISIAAMVIVFCAAIAILLKESSTKVVMIPISLFACVPVIAFAPLQFLLFVKICISTYGPGIFNKRVGH